MDQLNSEMHKLLGRRGKKDDEIKVLIQEAAKEKREWEAEKYYLSNKIQILTDQRNDFMQKFSKSQLEVDRLENEMSGLLKLNSQLKAGLE